MKIDWLYYPSLTENKIVKHLSYIRDKEKLPSSVFNDVFLNDLALSSNGDMR
jgi:hypothetical protein